MEAGGNAITYLEKFTETLNATKGSWKERRIVLKLKKIQDAKKSCLGWMEQEWEPVKEDFFSSLESLLRFLNHYALPEVAA
ncbi:interleukin 3 precursor [Patagioenas fasciata monilis]|uniref:Interleukin 3 n=1 Tax=Patagioenas fasciata monilis TaxID=372326 RepID=A0A1V4KUW9_PATFA|nr:interleukin 3 precursor [Patagioenas fasciata monilis]